MTPQQPRQPKAAEMVLIPSSAEKALHLKDEKMVLHKQTPSLSFRKVFLFLSG